MPDLIALTYVGNGGRRPDLPTRDIDVGELSRYSEDQRRMAVQSGLFQPVYAEPEADEHEEAPAVNLQRMKKAELVALAEQRGLDTTGTVAVLIERLMQPDPPASDDDGQQADDSSQASAGEPEADEHEEGDQ